MNATCHGTINDELPQMGNINVLVSVLVSVLVLVSVSVSPFRVAITLFTCYYYLRLPDFRLAFPLLRFLARRMSDVVTKPLSVSR
jgi:hypothetical protein